MISTTYIIIFVMAIIIAIFTTYFIFQNKIQKQARNTAPKKSLVLSLTEVYDVIDAVCEEIITNKYEIHYKLKEISIIPKMDEEIRLITTDIVSAFSPSFIDAVRMYYTEEYFIELITRRAQAFTIKYTQENKPKSK